MEKLTINDAIELINSQVSSIYTKQDVLYLLEKINPGSELDTEGIFVKKLKEIKGTFIDNFSNELDNLGHDEIIDNYDLKLYDNRIELDNIMIDNNEILSAFKRAFDEIVDELEYDLDGIKKVK